MPFTLTGGTYSGVFNPNIAYAAMNKLRSQKCVITGWFNSNGLRDNIGLVAGVQQGLMNNNIKIFGYAPFTIAELVSTSGGATATLQWSQRAHLGGLTLLANRSIAANYNIGMISLTGSYPGLAKMYQFGGGFTGRNSAGQYAGSYYPWNSVMGTVYTYSSYQVGLRNETLNADSYPYLPNFRNTFNYDQWYGTYSLTGGYFYMGVGQATASTTNLYWPTYTSLGTGLKTTISATSTATGLTSMSRARASITSGLSASFVKFDAGICRAWAGGEPSSAGISGDVVLGYGMVYEITAANGAIVAPFWSVGGQSMFDFAYSVSPSNPTPCADECIDHWIDVMSTPIQCTSPGASSQQPVFIWMLADAVNHCAEDQPSISGGYGATSASAYADNAIYVMNKIMTRWTAKGLSANNCYFWVYPDHTIPSDGKYPAYASTISGYVNNAYPIIYNAYPNNFFGTIPSREATPAELFNVGLSAETYYSSNAATYSTVTCPTASGASAAGTGIPITVSMEAGFTGGQYVRIRNSACLPQINGVHYVPTANSSTIWVQIPGLVATGVTQSGSAQLVSVDYIHMGTGIQYNSGISAGYISGYNYYTPKVLADLLGAQYTDFIRSDAGGMTGVNTLYSTTQRAIYSVSGTGSQSFTISTGVSSGTSDPWSASKMEMRGLYWSVAPGTTSSNGTVQILWENTGAAGTHTNIMTCMRTNQLNYQAFNTAIPNTCTNPSGNILVQSTLPSSGAYTIILDVGMPYSGRGG